MKKFQFLLFSVFAIACLFSCKPNGSKTVIINNAQQLIVGKWNLQQEKLTQYVNGAKQVDTMVNASDSLIAYAQFNQTGSYTSVTKSLTSSRNLTGPVPIVDSLAGTYTISNTSFNVSAPYLAGFIVKTAAPGTITEVPVVTLASHTVQLSQLTGNLLTVHMELVFNYMYSSAGVTTNYKTVSDLYYSK